MFCTRRCWLFLYANKKTTQTFKKDNCFINIPEKIKVTKSYTHSDSGKAVTMQHLMDLWSGHSTWHISCPRWGSPVLQSLEFLLAFPTSKQLYSSFLLLSKRMFIWQHTALLKDKDKDMLVVSSQVILHQGICAVQHSPKGQIIYAVKTTPEPTQVSCSVDQ